MRLSRLWAARVSISGTAAAMAWLAKKAAIAATKMVLEYILKSLEGVLMVECDGKVCKELLVDAMLEAEVVVIVVMMSFWSGQVSSLIPFSTCGSVLRYFKSSNIFHEARIDPVGYQEMTCHPFAVIETCFGRCLSLVFSILPITTTRFSAYY
jgi:hypothetical protein